jgi:hypothetical protein
MFNSYHFFLVSIVVILAYTITYLLVKTGKIPLNVHKMTWNYTLLAAFLISGILGLILAFLVDQKISISWYQNFLWLHVEFGIVMAIISIFHIIWHLRYYAILFAKNNSEQQ